MLMAIACICIGVSFAGYIYTSLDDVALSENRSQIDPPTVTINQLPVVEPKNELGQKAVQKDDHGVEYSEIATLEEAQYEIPTSGGVGKTKISRAD